MNISLSVIISIMLITLLASCQSTKTLTSKNSNVSRAQVSNIDNKENEHIQGTIELPAGVAFDKIINQILFIGLPQTIATQPIIPIEDSEIVKNSLVYQELIHDAYSSRYVMKKNGKNYFLYDAYRKQLEAHQLLEKFGY